MNYLYQVDVEQLTFKPATTSRELYAEFQRIENELQALGQLNLEKQPGFENELVDSKVLETKIKEFTTEVHKFQFHYSSANTHLRCLLNWIHSPPPQGTIIVDDNGEYAIGSEDEEFLKKLTLATKKIGVSSE